MWSRVLILAGALLCAGQDSLATWKGNQINATWCQWDSPRAALVRDTLYVDGGALRVLPGLSDGTYGEIIDDGNPYGLVYMLNFSTPFNTSANFTNVFANMSKAGTGFANNIAPNFIDGAMLANDEEWFTYGGQTVTSSSYSSPDADEVAKFMQYRSGPDRPFQPGWQREQLPPNITRYITNGAAVSIPSENLGYFFSGLRAEDWGPIEYSGGNASHLSLTMISLDLSVQNQEVWRNETLPSSVPGRANGELVWIPVAEKGVLIAIGGVIHPSFATLTQKLNVSETAESERVSPGFMTTVAIYDVASGNWYEQETSGNAPGQLTQGCTVVASAQDGSSHNIYWYGGYDGITLTSSDNFNDDVWVLSVPSFIWTKVRSGEIRHARARHKCVKPYPDQMIVVGGYSAPVGVAPKCVEGGVVQIFNLSSAEWIDSYDPTVWSEYSVPSAIYEKIGGSERGGANVLAPAGGWSNASLGALFGAKYDSNKITKWYPFQKAKEANNTIPTGIAQPTQSGGTPSYLAPVLGVVLGLFFITLVVLAILLWRRRKFLRARSATQSESETIENRRWIDNWLLGTPATTETKAPTVTTDETPMSAIDQEEQLVYVQPPVPEMGDGQVYEMDDTSRAVELHATGLVPIHDPKSGGLHPSPSVASQQSRTSTVSHISQSSISNRPGISPIGSPDYSPSHSHDGQQSPEFQKRIVSDMSAISETDRGHLRGISETSVSTVGGYATPLENLGGSASDTRSPGSPASPFGPDSYTQIRERERERSVGRAAEGDEAVSPRQDGGRPSLVSPLSPPDGHSGDDYLGAGAGAGVSRAPSSPSGGQIRRKSNFQENMD